MKSLDHKNLSYYWLERMSPSLPEAYRMAFVIGSIEPDRNLFTYLHGIWDKEKFRGHNFENVLPSIKKLMKLCRTEKRGALYYYRMGKCLHYIADIFTHPHNKEFIGDLRAHCEYERKLHEKFCAILLAGEQEEVLKPQNTEEKFQDMLKLHEQYIKEEHGFETDCKYILCATKQYLSENLEPENVYGTVFVV